MKKHLITSMAIAAHAATLPLANWTMTNVGDCTSYPCTVPIGPWVAPSGVIVIGLGFVTRDILQTRFGKTVALAAVALGSLVAFMIADPLIAVASVAAYAAGELSDVAIFSAFARKSVPLAIVMSGLVGAVIDSIAFLWLAFGSLQFIQGQIVGKVAMSVLAAAAVWGWKRR